MEWSAMQNLEPVLEPVPLKALRPTQLTVGYREVMRKRKEWQRHARKDGGRYLGRHMIPVVVGPKDRIYLIDHHHLARALMDDGVSDILVNLVADLSMLDKQAFWTYLDKRSWIHPFDAEGKRKPYSAIPKSIAELSDDPYRSLAGEVRMRGGYAKVTTPFFEFMWADFFRSHIEPSTVENDFTTAVDAALDLARKKKASFLPGWCGEDD